MSFWEELRAQVRERTTAGDISYELYDLIAGTGVAEVAIVQPTFYMGRFYILAHDFMDFTEKLLDAKSEPGEVFRSILYLRETARTMGRLIRHAAEPMEGMMQFLDAVYEDSLGPLEEDEEDEEHDEHDHDHEHAEAEEEFAAERDALRESLRVKLREVNLSDRVVDELSKRLADTYHGCVLFTRAIRQLQGQDAEDLPGFLAVVVEVQYVMDLYLRRLLLEDVFLEETPSFTTGLMPWISHAIEELAARVNERAAATTPA